MNCNLFQNTLAVMNRFRYKFSDVYALGAYSFHHLTLSKPAGEKQKNPGFVKIPSLLSISLTKMDHKSLHMCAGCFTYHVFGLCQSRIPRQLERRSHSLKLLLDVWHGRGNKHRLRKLTCKTNNPILNFLPWLYVSFTIHPLWVLWLDLYEECNEHISLSYHPEHGFHSLFVPTLAD